jgi:N-acetylglucosamine kinase-like BadF-type ATPase
MKARDAAMATDAAIDRVKSEISRAFEKTRADLDRIEILAAGLAAFSAPIPNYEPHFQHLRQLTLSAHELPSD